MALPLTALVLAGGSSTRLGTDKAFTAVRGRTLLERVLSAARSVGAETLILGDDPRLRSLGPRVLPDRRRGEGPLPALRDGLEAMSHDWAFATACDAPFLKPALIEYLWRWREGHDAVVPLTAMDREPKPLCALYSNRCLPAMTAALDRGERKMTAFYRDVRLVLVPEDSLRLVDPFLLSFHNVNTPEDLALAEEIAFREEA